MNCAGAPVTGSDGCALIEPLTGPWDPFTVTEPSIGSRSLSNSTPDSSSVFAAGASPAPGLSMRCFAGWSNIAWVARRGIAIETRTAT